MQFQNEKPAEKFSGRNLHNKHTICILHHKYHLCMAQNIVSKQVLAPQTSELYVVMGNHTHSQSR